jgi:hypothetical protein
LPHVIEDACFAQGIFNLNIGVLPERIEVFPQSIVEEERSLGDAGKLLPKLSHIHVEGVLSIYEILRLKRRLNKPEKSLYDRGFS